MLEILTCSSAEELDEHQLKYGDWDETFKVVARQMPILDGVMLKGPLSVIQDVPPPSYSLCLPNTPQGPGTWPRAGVMEKVLPQLRRCTKEANTFCHRGARFDDAALDRLRDICP